ncbi:cytidylyltransferase domain-containing protein [Flavobacterium sp.]|jgi:CMP-N,N'-diacetyllegionaminic acid synthase|uniref:acylneuraminate cytidylyltransferase family protein n=1 Tax=Flavobacterium sp. TaxID=239 RepID=UPI0037C0A65B
MDKILALIPSRSGSKRVPNKNIRPFGRGSNLTEIAIKQALGIPQITTVALTTDSEDLLVMFQDISELECIKRPAEISDDKAPAIAYVRHALKLLEHKLNIRYDYVMILQPTSPLRLKEDIVGTIQLMYKHPEADSAVSVMKVDHLNNPIKMKVMDGDELVPFFEHERGRLAVDQLPVLYVRNCAVYITRRKEIDTFIDVMGNTSVGYPMPAERSIDINEMIDFDIAEYLFNKK